MLTQVFSPRTDRDRIIGSGNSLTPREVMSGDKGDSQIGSSKFAGVHTKVLAATGTHFVLLFVGRFFFCHKFLTRGHI